MPIEGFEPCVWTGRRTLGQIPQNVLDGSGPSRVTSNGFEIARKLSPFVHRGHARYDLPANRDRAGESTLGPRLAGGSPAIA